MGGASAPGGSGGTAAAGGSNGTTAGAKSPGGSAAGGASGSGGTATPGGASNGGDHSNAGTGNKPTVPGELPTGSIRITDRVPGWASQEGGTTGGGTNLGGAKTVRTMAELGAAISGAGIILLEPGTYTIAELGDEDLRPPSNTSIIGKAPGVLIRGSIRIEQQNNVILRNFTVQGDPCDPADCHPARACTPFDACRDGDDAIVINRGSHHVWVDHVDVIDGQDGNLDIVEASDLVTVSWCHFHYTDVNKPHAFSNLISSSDGSTQDRDKLRITYMKNWWGRGVQERAPRGRYGKVHVFNNFYKTERTEGYLIGPGVEIQLLIENNMAVESPIKPFINTTAEWVKEDAYRATGNQGTAGGSLNMSKGNVFDAPYAYDLIAASEVEKVVTHANCGAGNTCVLEQ